jgi:hypothetical protein
VHDSWQEDAAAGNGTQQRPTGNSSGQQDLAFGRTKQQLVTDTAVRNRIQQRQQETIEGNRIQQLETGYNS